VNTEDMLRLKGMHIAPYMQLATLLIGKQRESGGNMFRHQIDTMAVLLDYGHIDSVLLKASVVHDLLEDIPDFNHNLLLSIDYESPQVYELVQEVSRRKSEPKSEFLTRIKQKGSKNAKILKVADRISNVVSLGYVNDAEFIARYTEETVRYVYPIAEEVSPAMLRELESLVASRREFLDSCMF
jgi:(p)ppGpp synthase/HD superfamily hydrolase